MAKRRGRKPKPNVARYPGGEIRVSEAKDPEPTLVGKLATARRLYLKELSDPRYRTQIGILQLEGRLTDMQAAAGLEWAKVTEDHRRIVMDQSPARAKVSQMEPRIATASREHEYDAGLIERTQDRYDMAYSAIVDGRDGVKAAKLVNRLCIEDERIEYWELELTRNALERLAVVFGFSGSKKVA